jgi:glycosyltransferase involved in cell wall biosynthesis
MPQLSLCILTFNEEKFLSRCLDSMKGIADEIIVLDSGSTDKTLEIAKKFRAKIYKHKWPDDYAKARNRCISHAIKGWILVLDPDETISRKDY